MPNALLSTCYKYRVNDDPVVNHHIHVAVVDCWDVLNTLEISASPQGGTWMFIKAKPFIKIDPTKTISDMDMTIVTSNFSELSNEVARESQSLHSEMLEACPTWKIDRSLFHLLINQHVDLYNPVREGVLV